MSLEMSLEMLITQVVLVVLSRTTIQSVLCLHSVDESNIGHLVALFWSPPTDKKNLAKSSIFFESYR